MTLPDMRIYSFQDPPLRPPNDPQCHSEPASAGVGISMLQEIATSPTAPRNDIRGRCRKRNEPSAPNGVTNTAALCTNCLQALFVPAGGGTFLSRQESTQRSRLKG